MKDKTFAYLSAHGDPVSISFKLPYTGYEAMQLPYAAPTGYGLGKGGWVTLTPGDMELPSLDRLEESYRATSPKSLVRLLEGR